MNDFDNFLNFLLIQKSFDILSADRSFPVAPVIFNISPESISASARDNRRSFHSHDDISNVPMVYPNSGHPSLLHEQIPTHPVPGPISNILIMNQSFDS
jgi:hypothetical protein